MKNLTVSGPFSHDMMMIVLKEMFPQLKPGRDYGTGHMVEPDTGTQLSDPFLMFWNPTDIPRPDDAAVKAEFEAHEAKYRAIFVRAYRDACLEWSDAKGTKPADAPTTYRSIADEWAVYRQALRDVPEQAGFPFDIDWPEMPG